MKRKKFVKQLMSLGYQRNNANALAMYARMGGWTYEQYLQIEKSYTGYYKALEDMKNSLAYCLAPVAKAATDALKKLHDAMTSVKWEFPAGTMWATEQVAEDPLPPWPKENPHRCDAVDALTYAARVAQGGGQE